MNWKRLLRTAQATIEKNSPAILMGMGITGMITAAVIAVRATPKAYQKLQNEKKKEKTENLPVKKVVKTVWKDYAFSIFTGAGSIACLIASARVQYRRNAALATAYKLSENAFTTYREKVVEAIGEKKEKNIKEKVAQAKMDKTDQKEQVVVVYGSEQGKVLCYDEVCGKEFLSDMQTLRSAQNNFNHALINEMEMYKSYNEWLDLINVEPYIYGKDLGWNVDSPMDINFTTTLRHGVPCIMLDYSYSPPSYDYRKALF